MVDGLVEVAVIGEPCRRDAVELFEVVGPVMLQSTTQELGEHVVVPIPARVIIHALKEQSASLDVFEHRLPARHPSQRRRQPTAGPLGDGRRQQELAQLRFQSVDDVLRQELADHIAGTG